MVHERFVVGAFQDGDAHEHGLDFWDGLEVLEEVCYVQGEDVVVGDGGDGEVDTETGVPGELEPHD